MNFVFILILAVIVFVTSAIGQGDNDLAKFCAFVFFISAIALYFSPSMVAYSRDHKNKSSIMILNLFLGWTVIGWVAALAWAYSSGESVATPSAISKQVQGEPKRQCPYCAEEILQAAIKCRHCGSEIPALDSGAGTIEPTL